MTPSLARTLHVEQDQGHIVQAPANLRAHHAYILLGDAGMGKSTLFRAECEALGEAAIYESVQDFLDLYDNTSPHDLIGKTLFLDGLDEARSPGDQSVTSNLRRLLAKLNRPRFRLSCREAEWFGQTDQQAFARLLPAGEQLHIAHLQPFSRDDVAEYLRQHDINAEVFIEHADHHRLSELLYNPQTLKMLVDAVADEQGWPQSKAEVFELACRKLAEEHNAIHQRKGARPVDDLLEAAGYWYTAMLLSGRQKSSVNLPDSRERLSLNCTPGFNNASLPLEPVLRSRLFQGDGKDGYLYPHRSIAEYLAARYISKRVAAGLPLLRIWPLLCGVDGGVVNNLRGLYGWMASLVGQNHHREVIEKDPVALLVYGDAVHFSRDSKSLLIRALQQYIRQHPKFRYGDDTSSWLYQALGTLAAPDMESIFREHLEPLSNTADQQQLAGCLLNAIEYGSPMPGLQQLLVTIVRNDKNWGGVRRYALQALLAHAANLDVCMNLLEALRCGEVPDPDREMLGSILDAYYPRHITPAQILSYFLPQKSSRVIGCYRYFWSYHLVKRTPPESLQDLVLQTMSMNCNDLHDDHIRYEHQELIGKLLGQLLAIQGRTLPVAIIGNWLLNGFRHFLGDSCKTKLHTWIQNNPTRYQLLLVHMLRSAPPDDPMRHFWPIWNLISQPEWLWQWAFDAIAKTELADIRLPLFELVKLGLHATAPYDLEVVYRLTQTYPELAPHMDSLVCNISDESWQVAEARRDRQRKAKEAERRKKNRHAIYLEKEHLAAGTASPNYLDWLAQEYWRSFPQGQQKTRVLTPLESIAAALDDDEELALLAMQALANTLQRKDLPSVDQLIAWLQENQYPTLFFACMAAARECQQISEQHLLAQSDDALSLLAAMVLMGPHIGDLTWHQTLLVHRADIVSSVYLHYLCRMLPKDRYINGIGYLLKDEQYVDVARRLLPLLFSSMPESISAKGWGAVRTLWLAGIHHTDTTAQRNWLDEQLATKRHKRQTRATLLALALALDPAAYQQAARDFTCSLPRTRLLAQALVALEDGRRLEQWPDELLAHQIKQFAAIYPPPVFEESMRSVKTEIGRMVDSMIHTLCNRTSDAASFAIRELLACPPLVQWDWQLRVAWSTHQLLRRHALFRMPTPAQAVATLDNGAPNGIADLQALLVHELRQLAKQMRDGSEGMYRQFWSEDQYGRVTKPKIENSGRNVLLAILKERFAPLALSLTGEGAYADGNRADISIEYARSGLRLPIEIKRSDHAELWTAVSEQLVPRYTRDPGSYGYGVYLVLWFGTDTVTAPPRPLARPTSASELEQMLTDRLSEMEQPLIKICVVDVAAPNKT